MDKIIYGFEVMMVNEDGDIMNNVFFVSHKDNIVLEFLERGKKHPEKLEIAKITQVEFGWSKGNFIRVPREKLVEYNMKLCLTMFINAKSYDLIFFRAEDVKEFCYAIISLWEGEKEMEHKEYLKR